MNAPLNVVIVGGGTSGWMCGAALAHIMKVGRDGAMATVRLIESSDIGIVGVGEATLPHIKDFNDLLGINEAEFMRETRATFKLGIEFVDWGKIGNSYIHPFGAFGQPLSGTEFHHVWTRGRQLGVTAPLDDYSYAIVAARQQKFDFPSEDIASIKSTYSYAYHFDAGLYAPFLRRFAEARGLRRTDGKIVDVRVDAASGNIAAVVLDSGEVVTGDLFIDCSGFRSLLTGAALNVGWQDWAQWLPCDRAMAVPCEAVPSSGTDEDFSLTPYTRSTALEAGWQWRIPLQHRTGNGYVYSSAFISDEDAARRLVGNLDGKALADPRPLRFRAGRREKSWTKNCIAMGLASGFLEPLESTSIYLAQIAVTNLLQLWPQKAIDPHLRDEFNRLVDNEYDRVRDFLILHYHANSRDDGELWAYTRNMPVPDSLTAKIEQFKRRGHIVRYKDGLFSPASWLAVFTGQDVLPAGYDRLVDNFDDSTVVDKLGEMKNRINSGVDLMQSHAAFIHDYCAAKSDIVAGKLEQAQ